MRQIYLLIILLGLIHTCIGQVAVKGYYRKDGTYVQPHYRSSPDGNPYNNYSYPGNINPYTGKIATGNPSTYLNNYYKIYPNSSTSSFNFSNYTNCLVYTNYKGIKYGNSYVLNNKLGEVIGNVVHYKSNSFKIYDLNNTHIGYVYMRKKGKRYEVYDLHGYKVQSNKFKIDWSTIGFVFVGGVLFYALAATN